MTNLTGCRAARLTVGGTEISIRPTGVPAPSDTDYVRVAGRLSIVKQPDGQPNHLRVARTGGALHLDLVEQTKYTVAVRAGDRHASSAGFRGGVLVESLTSPDASEAVFNLDTGNSVGSTSLVVRWRDSQDLEQLLDLWVRPAKLSADEDFEWLVDAVARAARALAFDLVGATSLPWSRTAQAPSYDYEDLVFLRSVILDVERAVDRIDRRPHDRVTRRSAWADVSLAQEIDTRLLMGVVAYPEALGRASPAAQGRLLPPAARTRFMATGGVRLVPTHIPVVERPRDRDTYENRFVRFALETLRRPALAIADHARVRSKRGLAADADEIAARCGALLRRSFLEGVGTLSAVHSTSQVLLREDAYHQVLRAYLEFLLAADVEWDELRRLQEIRDIATLYEMWVYIEVVRAVARLTGGQIAKPGTSTPSAVRIASSGLVVDLAKGRESALAIRGPTMSIVAYYNRQFSRLGEKTEADASWQSRSLPLRPDVTLEVHTSEGTSYVLVDAKYRIERLGTVFAAADEDHPDVPPIAAATTTFQREDVYKMHTYRDAIVGAHAAIAVYPGQNEVERLYLAVSFDSGGGVGAAPLLPGVGCDRSMLDRALGRALGDGRFVSSQGRLSR